MAHCLLVDGLVGVDVRANVRCLRAAGDARGDGVDLVGFGHV